MYNEAQLTHMYSMLTYYNARDMNQRVQGKQSNTNQDNTLFKGKGAALGGTRTHDTLLTRQGVLFLLSYQGSSAGRALSLQHNTTQHNTRQGKGMHTV